MNEQKTISPRLYSIKDAGKYLGRSEWSMRRLIWAGHLPSVRIGGRIHLDVKDMDTLIEQHKETEQN
jgi:excisionase family DNA binding protein